MEKQLVVFDLLNEHYGVDVAAVESIVKLQPITAIPQVPDYVEGVTSLRGAVLPVVDLRRRFGFPAAEASRDTRIVVVEMKGQTLGMVVDAVSEVLRVAQEDIEPPPSIVTMAGNGPGSRAAFVTGIAKVGERLIMLLDLAQVLNVGGANEIAG
jgi:purine-binding chemotaxis protein CheW